MLIGRTTHTLYAEMRRRGSREAKTVKKTKAPRVQNTILTIPEREPLPVWSYKQIKRAVALFFATD